MRRQAGGHEDIGVNFTPRKIAIQSEQELSCRAEAESPQGLNTCGEQAETLLSPVLGCPLLSLAEATEVTGLPPHSGPAHAEKAPANALPGPARV